MKKQKHIGQDFDDFLGEQGLLAEVEAASLKRVIAFRIEQEMEKEHMSKSSMAGRDIHAPPKA